MRRSLSFLTALCILAISTRAAFAQKQVTTPFSAQKPELHGLVNMGVSSFNNHDTLLPDNMLQELKDVEGIFDGTVINVLWSQLQPNTSVDLDVSAIDNALKAIRDYNARNAAHPLLAKLRIWSGPHAPNWIMQMNGGSVTVYKHFANSPTVLTEQFPHYWTVAYRQAWRALLNALATKYDAEPLISAYAVSSCSSATDEPFAPVWDKQSRANLLAAGYTDAQYQDCLLQALDDYAAWKQTNIEFTFNPLRIVDADKPTLNDDFTFNLMKACRAALGQRCILSNHNLGSDNHPETYQHIQQFGSPIAFQTASTSVIVANHKDLDTVIKEGVAYGASSVEIWPDTKTGFSAFAPDMLHAWSAALRSVQPVAPMTATPLNH